MTVTRRAVTVAQPPVRSKIFLPPVSAPEVRLHPPPPVPAPTSPLHPPLPVPAPVDLLNPPLRASARVVHRLLVRRPLPPPLLAEMAEWSRLRRATMATGRAVMVAIRTAGRNSPVAMVCSIPANSVTMAVARAAMAAHPCVRERRSAATDSSPRPNSAKRLHSADRI